jgi:hypothetical protein
MRATLCALHRWIALTALFLAGASAQNLRDLFLERLPDSDPARPVLKFRVELDRAGRPEAVPATYRFRSGDRFRFSFELNSSRYIYIVDRSIEGDSDQTGSPKLQLLWPPANGNALVAGRTAQTIPGPKQFFEFDANPGTEKISLLVSPHPVDLGVYFPSLGRPPATRLDPKQEVVAELRAVDANTTTEPGIARGTCVADCSQYSAPKDPAQPFIVTVDLIHVR